MTIQFSVYNWPEVHLPLLISAPIQHWKVLEYNNVDVTPVTESVHIKIGIESLFSTPMKHIKI